MTPPIAIQLYTVRDLLPQDLAGTLEKIAAMGYAGVETAFFTDQVTPAQVARLCRELDLTIVAAHCEIPLGEQKKGMLDLIDTLNCPRITWHGWPRDEGYSSVEGIKRLAERYNEANAVARAHGLQFGLHNHWWEFEPAEGHYPYQLLLEYLEPGIFFELDTYWVKTAGLDPVKVLAELGDRVPLLHIKDGPARQEDPMVAVGEGVMDVKAIAQAAGEVTEWMIVELDACATDMLTAVEQSYRYLTQHGLAQGKTAKRHV